MNVLLKGYNDLQFGIKIALSGVMLFIPLFMLLYLFYSGAQYDIDFVEDEITGAHYVPSVYSVQTSLAAHRGLVSSYISGNRTLGTAIEGVRKKVDAALASLKEADQRYGAQLKTGDRVDSIVIAWNKLKANSQSLSEKESFKRHTQLIEEVIGLTAYVGDTSKLILDPELDSYYLMDLEILALPALIEDTGKTRALGTLLAQQGSVTSENKTQIAILLDRIESHKQRVLGGLETVYANDSIGGLQEAFAPVQQSFTAAIDNFTAEIQQDFLMGEFKLTAADSTAVFSKGTTLIKDTITLAGETNKYLIDILRAREMAQSSFMQSKLVVIAIFMVIAVVIGGLSIRYLTSRIRMVVRVLERLSQGNYENRFDMIYNDEIGEIQGSLLSMQSALKENIERVSQSAKEGARITQALDGVNTGVLLADELGEIYFVNSACSKLFHEIEMIIQVDLPDFNAAMLVGQQVESCLGEAASVNNLTELTSVSLAFGGVYLDMDKMPILNESGEIIGYALEITDRSLEVQVEENINEVVAAAAEGNLSGRLRIQTDDKFFNNLATSLNELLSISENIIQDVLAVLSSLSEGDLTSKIDKDYQGSFGALKENANKTVDRLYSIIQDIMTATNQVSIGIKEIANGNLDLSARTEEQASSLEETASSMEEMTGTIRQNQDRAVEANEKSTLTQRKSQEGKVVVDEAIVAMGKINEASRKIVEIISVIDEIAFQTNLLALNAAVEAARAGDQGRGFAVVASEVRTLAQRSASAAKEIKNLIQDSVAKIEQGSQLVNSTGEALEEINKYAEEVSKMMDQLSNSAKEQTDGVSQVNNAITEMDLNTQKNAALVEETTATSNAMTDLAADLTNRMSFFNLGEQELDAAVGSESFARNKAASASLSAGGDSGISTIMSSSSAVQNYTNSSAAASGTSSLEPIQSPLNPSRSLTDDDEWDEF